MIIRIIEKIRLGNYLSLFLNCETCSINLAVTYLFFHNKYTLSNRDKDCIVILFYNCPEIALNVAGTI